MNRLSGQGKDLNIKQREVLRYLGYHGQAADAEILRLMDEAANEIRQAAVPCCVWQRYPLIRENAGVFQAGPCTLNSMSLEKNLKNCGEVILFAATLGYGIDRILNRLIHFQISKAAVFQAAAAAAIEDYCDQCQKKLEQMAAEENLYIRPRFSPGYGDLSLECQSVFLHTLQAEKTAGILLSEGGVMIPEKSVTAIMGLSKENSHCHSHGCEECSNINCLYRR